MTKEIQALIFEELGKFLDQTAYLLKGFEKALELYKKEPSDELLSIIEDIIKEMGELADKTE
jgi:hypothetical protein